MEKNKTINQIFHRGRHFNQHKAFSKILQTILAVNPASGLTTYF